MILETDWLTFIVTDEVGNIFGLSEDATPEAKEQYKRWLKKNENGMRP